MLCTYPALFHREDDGFWVEFPDVPGCYTQGDTLEEAREMASDALGLHLRVMLRKNMPLDPPSDPAALPAGDDVVALVTAEVPDTDRAAV